MATADWYDDDDDDPPVQCWHTEADTVCDWNICRQPERLARGDVGIDPALETVSHDVVRRYGTAGRR